MSDQTGVVVLAVNAERPWHSEYQYSYDIINDDDTGD